MREAGCLGAFLGGIFGVVSGACLAMAISQGNDFLAGMIMVLSVPASGVLFLVIGTLLLRRLKATLDLASTTASRLRIASLSTLCYLGLLSGCLFPIYWLRRPPSDEIMLAHFAKNRAIFETLQQMARKDSRLERVDDTWTRPENPEKIGVSAERIRTYRDLMQKSGVPRGFNHYSHSPGIEFNYWLQGSAISNDFTKGFLYTTKLPKPLYKTLNTLRSHESGFRHIEGNWYLFYEFLPG